MVKFMILEKVSGGIILLLYFCLKFSKKVKALLDMVHFTDTTKPHQLPHCPAAQIMLHASIDLADNVKAIVANEFHADKEIWRNFNHDTLL